MHCTRALSCWLSILLFLGCSISSASALYTRSPPGEGPARANVYWRRHAEAEDTTGPSSSALALADPTVIEDRLPHVPDASTLEGRDVWNPPILAPDAASVWKQGSTVTVRWDTTHAPQHATNSQGTLYLGRAPAGDTSEHLDIEHPLAKDFSLSQGSVQITVPHVEPRKDYIVVLMGDSGNRSPAFTIE